MSLTPRKRLTPLVMTLTLFVAGAAHAVTTVFLSAGHHKAETSAELVLADSLDAVEQALVADAGIGVVLIDAGLLDKLDPQRLRGLYDEGLMIAVANGQISHLAAKLAVDTNLTDYPPTRSRPVGSVAALMALFDENGLINGHHAFNDGVEDLDHAVSRLARMKHGFEQSDRRPEKCSWGNLHVRTFTGPAGTQVVGWTQVVCSGGDQFGKAITSTSNHDQVKVLTVTYNNCGWWHQISNTTRYGTNYAAIPDPGVLAGDPSQCGTKFQADTVHSAKKGSVWYSSFTTSCAGSC